MEIYRKWMLGGASGLAVAGVLALAAPAAAQVPDEKASVIDDIVVTARKREESLQTVPLAITAVTEETIREAGIDSVEDVARMTPGFTFTPLFGGAGSTPVIRGQSTTIGEPNVGFFVDGVYQSSRAVMDAMLGGDVARIEVAKGPQSALYGRNTFGGAVNYITKAPTNDPSGSMEATAGDHDLLQFRGSISMPLVEDRLFSRMGLSFQSRDGYWTNGLTGASLDDYASLVITGGLEFRPADNLSFRLRLAREDTDQGDFPIRFAVNDAVPAQPAGPAFPPAFQLVQGDVQAFDAFAVTPGHNDREFFTGSLTAVWDAGPVTVTSITGYNDLNYDTAADLDYEARRIRYQTQRIDLTEASQELRIESNGEGPVSWLAGANYYRLESDTDIDDRIAADAAGIAAAVPAAVRRQLQGGVRNLIAEETESKALFGQIIWRASDRLRFTVEGRQTWETKTVDAVDIAQFSPPPVAPRFVEEADFNNFVPRFTVDYRVNPDVMLYATAAKAVKVGGFNVVTTTGAILPSERSYDSEQAWTYEAGAKTSWFDNRLVLNGDVYVIKWTDQIVRALGATFAVLNANAGETTSQGAELEFRAYPVDGLDITGGVAYTDASYDSYTFGALAALGGNPVLDGTRLQYVSEWTWTTSVQYRRPLTGTIDWVGRIDASHQSDQSAVQPANTTLPANTVVNLRTGFDFNENLSFRVFVNNLTDEDAPVAAAYVPSASARFDWVRGAVGAGPRVGYQAFGAAVSSRPPRTWGVSLGYRF